MFKKLGWGLLLATLIISIACSSGDSPLNSSAQQGTISVNLHDQANPTISVAMMTIDAASLTDADGVVYDLDSSQLGAPFDLALLVGGNDVNLGVEPVPAGNYVSLQFTVSDLTVDLSDGSTVNVINSTNPLAVQVPLSVIVAEGEDVVIDVDFPLTAISFNGSQWTVDQTQVALD